MLTPTKLTVLGFLTALLTFSTAPKANAFIPNPENEPIATTLTENNSLLVQNYRGRSYRRYPKTRVRIRRSYRRRPFLYRNRQRGRRGRIKRFYRRPFFRRKPARVRIYRNYNPNYNRCYYRYGYRVCPFYRR